MRNHIRVESMVTRGMESFWTLRAMVRVATGPYSGSGQSRSCGGNATVMRPRHLGASLRLPTVRLRAVHVWGWLRQPQQVHHRLAAPSDYTARPTVPNRLCRRRGGDG